MAQLRRAEGKIQMSCGADKFFSAWTQNTNLVSEMSPHRFPKIEKHHATSWHSQGALMSWHYVAPNGKSEFVKTKVAEIDEKNKSVRYDYVDGHILRNYYKSFNSQIQAIPKDDGQQPGCFVKWSFDYEKKTDDAPDVDIYIDFLLGCAKDMDAPLCARA